MASLEPQANLRAIGDDGKPKERAKPKPVKGKADFTFLEELPEIESLGRGRGQDQEIAFVDMVKYAELVRNGKVPQNADGTYRYVKIVFEVEGSDSAKQKAATLVTAMRKGKYDVPDGWEWQVSAKPLIGTDETGKKVSVGSQLFFRINKALPQLGRGQNKYDAKGKVVSDDPLPKPRKPKAKADAAKPEATEQTESTPAEQPAE